VREARDSAVSANLSFADSKISSDDGSYPRGKFSSSILGDILEWVI
jgi:hypothetical protein